jgi:hypothetical protein
MWTKVSKTEALLARDAGKTVKFTLDGWMVDEPWVDATLNEKGAAIVDDLTKEAAAVFTDMAEYTHEMETLAERVGGGPTPLQHDKKTGLYTTPWRECECGEQYLVHMEHERTSERHKTWATGGIEVPVPHQPLADMYQRGVATPALELGVNKVCPRCGAQNKKGEDYYPDRDSRADRRIPCRRCNGHGVIPNVGPT